MPPSQDYCIATAQRHKYVALDCPNMPCHGRYIYHQTWTLVRISNISLLLFSSPKCRSAAAVRTKKQAAQILQLLSHAPLLQPAVMVERCKKYVLYVWRVLYSPATSWHRIHRIISYHRKILLHAGNQR